MYADCQPDKRKLTNRLSGIFHQAGCAAAKGGGFEGRNGQSSLQPGQAEAELWTERPANQIERVLAAAIDVDPFLPDSGCFEGWRAGSFRLARTLANRLSLPEGRRHAELSVADADRLVAHFADAEKECGRLIDHRLALPAYDQCLKASHLFNLLDARGAVSVTERAAYILRVRALAKACCETWLAVSNTERP